MFHDFKTWGLSNYFFDIALIESKKRNHCEYNIENDMYRITGVSEYTPTCARWIIDKSGEYSQVKRKNQHDVKR